ncbi:MAG: 3-hydroxyacyl-CoA dehydrogenase family protein [Gemmatimonadetes bacterium]|nr:3-hydroxyacyl-CoA dehydrogenase family protein [Gemmatimonadota bacterium]MBI3082261.1 3-hydroxyacyl-CoA dehydrogenase family protein [Gemmatimonadota bacterium]
MRIAVVGAGTMGHGIAQVAAIAGYQTRLTDADLSAKDAALATNTSSLSIQRIAEVTGRAERVVGMHFFNPVHIMKLVEIVTHQRMARDTVRFVTKVARRMGKDPIVVRDSPGFASSRLGVVLGLEAMRMVEQRVATPEDIDKAMELGYGHPLGPLKVSDLVGLDVRLAIAEYLFRELRQPHYQPPVILREKVRAGELGKKTGKGFYQWPKEPS